MKRLTALILMAAIALPLMAADRDKADRPYSDEVAAILAPYMDRAPADLTLSELNEIGAALSIPMQKAAYVHRSAMASMMMPGLGQFMNGDAVSGSLFLAADVAVAAGTIVGYYFLMPEELRFSNLDYLHTPALSVHDQIKTAYESMSLSDMLPLAGVVAGGAILHHIIAHVSAHHASQLAKDRIASGAVEFTPISGMLAKGLSHPGIGLGMHLRY